MHGVVTLWVCVIVALLALIVPNESAKVKSTQERSTQSRRILIFGGNGFIGATTVQKLVERGDKVTIVNRGNWYWDSKERVQPHVTVINCDRKNNVSSCAELTQLVTDLGSGSFDAVIDLSSYGPQETRDALGLLRGKVSLYVHISTDSVYDVCDIHHPQVPLKEEEAVRPEDPYRRDLLKSHHDYGNKKLEAEEELVKQRSETGGVPYVILRLPDVIGPRDTTYRFWIYQLWIKLASALPQQPIIIPKYLVDYKISFVYVDDVASGILSVLEPSKKEAVVDQIFNLAWSETTTLKQLIHDIEEELGVESLPIKTDDASSNIYFYPSARSGPVDPSKAIKAFGWKTTPWKEALKETVSFYETALTSGNYRTQMDEIIQIQAMQFFPGDKLTFYNTVEKVYNVNLSHFKPHDEL